MTKAKPIDDIRIIVGDDAEMVEGSYWVAMRFEEIDEEHRNAPPALTIWTIGDLHKAGYAGIDIRPGDEMVLDGFPILIVANPE